ncbi:MAG: hypothetical protein IJC16_08910 [Rikenellaceae bacterium]|nr:hypothetical protein [Rikenellaceae bacterium]
MEEPVLNAHNKQEYPPMHTAEHLVSGAVSRMLGCGRPVTTHIERRKSKCDFRCDRNLTEEETRAVEHAVNEAIAAGVDVTAELVSREEAARSFDLGRLPDDAGGTVRIVRVGDFDACPCIGDHVANTREIPPVRIVSSDCTDGILRVRFKFDKA